MEPCRYLHRQLSRLGDLPADDLSSSFHLHHHYLRSFLSASLRAPARRCLNSPSSFSYTGIQCVVCYSFGSPGDRFWSVNRFVSRLRGNAKWAEEWQEARSKKRPRAGGISSTQKACRSRHRLCNAVSSPPDVCG